MSSNNNEDLSGSSPHQNSSGLQVFYENFAEYEISEQSTAEYPSNNGYTYSSPSFIHYDTVHNNHHGLVVTPQSTLYYPYMACNYFGQYPVSWHPVYYQPYANTYTQIQMPAYNSGYVLQNQHLTSESNIAENIYLNSDNSRQHDYDQNQTTDTNNYQYELMDYVEGVNDHTHVVNHEIVRIECDQQISSAEQSVYDNTIQSTSSLLATDIGQLEYDTIPNAAIQEIVNDSNNELLVDTNIQSELSQDSMDHIYAMWNDFNQQIMNHPDEFSDESLNDLLDNIDMSDTNLSVNDEALNSLIDEIYNESLQGNQNIIQVGGSRLYTILQNRDEYVERFRMNIKTILFKLNNISINTAVDDIKCALNEIINFITNDYEAHDRVQFEFINNSQPERNFYISFRRVDQVNSDVVCERLNRVLQSNSQFLYTDMCTLKAWLIKTPVGSGRRILRPGESLTEFLALKKSIIIVKDMMPHMCLPLCIIVGVEMLFNTTFVKDISHKRYTATKWQILMNKAVDLCIEGGIQHVRDTGMGLDELSIFQSVLDERFRNGVINKRIKIVVFADFEASVLWQGFEDSHNVEQIRILLFANHYYLIKSTTGTFSCQYFCDYCNRRYGRRGDHVCKYRCERCTLAPKCNIDDIHEKYCNDCNRKFYGLNCYQNHIRANVCQKIRFCNLCRSTFRNLRRGEVHVCGMIYCKVCLQKRPSDHQCYIPKYTPKTLKNRLFIFIDFECTQDTVGELDGPEHVPNLCITHQICENCLQYEDKTYACSTCNQREQIFPETCFQDCMGDCIMRKVFSYLYDLENKGFNMIIIGHNIGLYDGHIFLKYLFNNNVNANRVPEMIVNGTKIYAIKVSESIKIIDSLNFFGVALSKLPQMYGFSGYKGFFPHMFNSNNHWNYMGVIPDKKYFVPESMKSSDLVEFNKWYDERAISNEPWIFCEELIRYCSNDVTILRKACVSFYNYFMSHFKFDVFTNAITIASACNKVFRFKFLESDSLGIIPKNGYRMHEKQSVIALQWLYWIEVTRGITIKHAGNGSEKKISSYRVDGYFQDPITREETIFEFYGCYYHGCPKCYDCLTQDDENTLKILERRENTFHRLNYFKNRFRVEVVWECEFRSMLKNDPTILSIANSTPYTEVTPLNPRDAFFGGRTNVIKYYHKVDSNEKIKYYDVCSLYPFINKTYKVPVGHPKVLIGDDANRLANNLIGFEGFVKCKVLPPRDLYHPVLPQKLHNKLMFHLCLKCAETFTETCAHSDEERSFVGTWVSDELKKAVEKGYRILKVYEAWQYTVKTGLFTEYVNAFLKDKAEASGYPEWAVTDDRKNEYIEEFNRKEGVLLDKQNINKNPPKRSTAKLILNSFWGKFGENVDLKSSVKLINDSLEFFRLVTSPDIDISKIIVLNPENLLVVYKETVESRLPLNTINVAIAAYTTAGARLQLYNYLDQLNTRILYFDTDSIIFTEKSGEQSPELGDYLGDLTDELCEYGAGSFISEFVSGGPKNYAFCVTTPGSPLTHYSCKVKGFTLNSKNSEKINFSTIKEMVLKLMGDPDDTHGDDISDDDNVIVTEEMKIRRHGLGRLYTKTEKKVYKVTSGKRKLVGNYNTLPWGFI